MDYVVGGVAALISGNVTPSRPKHLRRPLTPTKHQPSPNVTPKSEFVEDRSIFLSPTLQKKKAIVKKSPKRIFQNPDLEVTDNGDQLNSSSPKIEKVKKHLKDDLEADTSATKQVLSPKSPKRNSDMSDRSISPKKKIKMDCNKLTSDTKENNKSLSKKMKKKIKGNKNQDAVTEQIKEIHDQSDSKKKKKKDQSIGEICDEGTKTESNEISQERDNVGKNNKKGKKKVKGKAATPESSQNKLINLEKKKMQKKKPESEENEDTNEENKLEQDEENPNVKTQDTDSRQESNITSNDSDSIGKKKKKGKNKAKDIAANPEENQNNDNSKKKKKQKKKSNIQAESKFETHDDKDEENELELNYVNPNAITNEDTDSEHESDDDMASDNETINKKAFESGPPSSDDEDEKTDKQASKPDKSENEAPEVTKDEVKRTLFVGNVPLSKKTKKEIKKIFSEYGKIDTVRIRTVPVKDARMTPKMAVIKNELHPDRTTVNVYVKYEDAASVDAALSANNMVLNDCHLRVSRSESTGAAHDPKCSVFVGNIPFGLEDEGLREKFLSCGDIESVRIVRDKKTNAGKGFGYVNFASKDGVELALALTEEDLTIKNRILRIKRCTQITQKKQGNNKPGFQNRNSQGNRQRFGDKNSLPNRQSFGDRNQGNRQGFGDRNQGKRQGFADRNNQGNKPRFGDRNNQGNRQGFGDRNNQGNRFGDKNNQGSRQGFGDRNNEGNRPRFGDRMNQMRQNFSKPGQSGDKDSGAYRRVMNKRKRMEGSEGPPNKRARDADQPVREKKARKEFVGMTAEKKKKPKFSKGQKKKKALSEILTKN